MDSLITTSMIRLAARSYNGQQPEKDEEKVSAPSSLRHLPYANDNPLPTRRWLEPASTHQSSPTLRDPFIL